MRLFIAIELDDAFRGHLVRLQDIVRRTAPGVTLTRPENLHLTLKFLGNVRDQDVVGLCRSLKDVPHVGAFFMCVAAAHRFPERGNVRVIAAGVEETSGTLARLNGHIEDVMAKHKFSRQTRAFKPHITIARVNRPVPVKRSAVLVELSKLPGVPAMNVTQFTLMQSQLGGAKPARYTPLARFKLESHRNCLAQELRITRAPGPAPRRI